MLAILWGISDEIRKILRKRFSNETKPKDEEIYMIACKCIQCYVEQRGRNVM